MNVRYINPFIKASKAVIGATLGEQADIGRPSIAPIEFELEDKQEADEIVNNVLNFIETSYININK